MSGLGGSSPAMTARASLRKLSFDRRRVVPLLAEVGEEAGDLLDAVERRPADGGELLQLGVGEVAVPVLDLAEALHDHAESVLGVGWVKPLRRRPTMPRRGGSAR